MQPNQITINKDQKIALEVTGEEYFILEAGIKKLPWEIAQPILEKLVSQILEQSSKKE